MAFDYTNLYPDTSGNGGFTKSWNYTTVVDSVAAVSADGYFNKVASRLGIGDNIIVAQVDAFDKRRTALLGHVELFVTSITGGIVKTVAASSGGGGAPIDSPAFTGTPTAPTAAPGTNTTQIATTEYADAINAARVAAEDLKANIASPTFTGTPAAPTAAANTNTTQLATTAYADAINALRIAAEALKAPLASPALTGTPTAPTATAGTSSMQLATTAFVEAVRVALVAADALKAPLASPAFTGTPTGITKTHVGLGNVDNTADTAKPVSTAQQTALDLKAPLASPALTGTPTAPTATVGTNTTQLATTAFVLANAGSGGGASPATVAPLADGTAAVGTSLLYARQDHVHPTDTTRAPLASPAFTGTPTGITKAHVGLGSVDNTADTAKPVSTAQQTALDLKAPLASPAFTGTPTGITKTHVGLGNVDNTADTAKPVSTATTAAIAASTATVTKTSLGLGNVDNTADTAKPVSTAQQTALNLKAAITTLGAWTTPAFSAGNFTAVAGMGWTVASGDVATFMYKNDTATKTLSLAVFVTGTSTAGGDNSLRVTLPLGLVAATRCGGGMGLLVENGTSKSGIWDISSGSTFVTLLKSDRSNFAASSSALTVAATIEIPTT